MEEAADLVVGYGGSLSGEHGDGQARAELLPKMFGPELIQAFREFKTALGSRLEDESRQGGRALPPGREPAPRCRLPSLATRRPTSSFLEDHGSLAHATLRCVGVGKCRRYEGGVMCPSFRVTREEEHSTRGRAHLLWEMAKGEVIRMDGATSRSKIRSTSASPAKVARPNVLSA